MKYLARTTCLLLLTLPVAGNADVIAFDMVGSSSQNLVGFTNIWNGAFSSPGDGFQKYRRGVSGSIPFSVLDDSLVTFPTDTLGIIDDNNTHEFFGVTDTVNGDSPGTVSAEWIFDISGFENLSMSLDVGAMGDFEASDIFVWSYSIDGGVTMDAFASTVDEAGMHTYTLAGGAMFDLNDPMLLDGVVLTNELANFMTSLLGAGDLLTLTLTASTDGGSEAFAFQNLVISGDRIAAPAPATVLLIAFGLGMPYFLRRKRTI